MGFCTTTAATATAKARGVDVRPRQQQLQRRRPFHRPGGRMPTGCAGDVRVCLRDSPCWLREECGGAPTARGDACLWTWGELRALSEGISGRASDEALLGGGRAREE